MNSPDPGTLYVLSNVDGSLAKIGLTRCGSPNSRSDDYSKQHGIAWHVYWSAVTDNVAEAEAAAHRALEGRRFSLVPEAHEIFHVTPEVARRAAERFVVPPAGDAAPAQAAAPAPRWIAYLEPFAATALTELGRIVTARLRRYRYGRQILAAQSLLQRLLSSKRS